MFELSLFVKKNINIKFASFEIAIANVDNKGGNFVHSTIAYFLLKTIP